MFCFNLSRFCMRSPMNLKNQIRLIIILLLVSISSCQNNSPDDVVKSFVELLHQGNCEAAISLTTGSADETVQGLKDAGCNSWTGIVLKTHQRKIDSNFQFCIHYQVQAEIIYHHIYLTKIQNEWKIYKFQPKESIVNCIGYKD